MYADHGRIERHFEVGYLVYLHLQPYKKSTLKENGAKNLKLHFYGPYKVIKCVGKVAYELDLPKGSKIHNIFHVSCLKKAIGRNVVSNMDLPQLMMRAT